MKKHIFLLALVLLLSGCSSKSNDDLITEDEFIIIEDEDSSDNLKEKEDIKLEEEKEDVSNNNGENLENKTIGYKMSDIKKLYENKEINFTFEHRILVDGKDTYTGQSESNKGAAILEILGNIDTDQAEGLTLMVLNSSDDSHNLFNYIYLLGILKNYTTLGDDASSFLTESIGLIIENPEKEVTKEIDGNILKLSFEPILGSITLSLFPNN